MCWYAAGRSSTAPVRRRSRGRRAGARRRDRRGRARPRARRRAGDRRRRRVRDARDHRHPHPRRRRDVVEPRPRPAARLRQHERRVRLLRQLDRAARRRAARRDRRPARASSRTSRSRRFDQELPWTWERWPEYSAALAAQPTAVNVGGYLGHLAAAHLRDGRRGVGAGGHRRRDRARCASCSTRACATARSACRSNHFDKDRTLRLVPGFFADDDEYARAARRARPPPRPHVPGDHPVQRPRPLHRRRRALRPAVRRRRRARPVAGHPDRRPRARPSATRRCDLHRPAARRRASTAGPTSCSSRSSRSSASSARSCSSACRRGTRWSTGPPTQKLATLADPAWRDRARHDWEDRPQVDRPPASTGPTSLIFAISENGAGPARDLASPTTPRRAGLHVSDALAEWLLRQRHRLVARRHAGRARRGRRRRACCAIRAR